MRRLDHERHEADPLGRHADGEQHLPIELAVRPHSHGQHGHRFDLMHPASNGHAVVIVGRQRQRGAVVEVHDRALPRRVDRPDGIEQLGVDAPVEDDHITTLELGRGEHRPRGVVVVHRHAHRPIAVGGEHVDGGDCVDRLQQLGLPGRGSGDGVVLDADANDDADSHQPTW
ncbi:MAG: hypothetical protein IPP16_20520 [Acidimicrobiaceae bacterium]|nr:hypothetical protein [Acidimicrobiaceae bacterium]